MRSGTRRTGLPEIPDCMIPVSLSSRDVKDSDGLLDSGSVQRFVCMFEGVRRPADVSPCLEVLQVSSTCTLPSSNSAFVRKSATTHTNVEFEFKIEAR